MQACLGRDWFSADRETIGIDREAHIWVDSVEFEELPTRCTGHKNAEDQVCSRCVSSHVKAMDLYRGDFMAGFGLRDSVSFDDWQLSQSERLRLNAERVGEGLTRPPSGST